MISLYSLFTLCYYYVKTCITCSLTKLDNWNLWDLIKGVSEKNALNHAPNVRVFWGLLGYIHYGPGCRVSLHRDHPSSSLSTPQLTCGGHIVLKTSGLDRLTLYPHMQLSCVDVFVFLFFKTHSFSQNELIIFLLLLANYTWENIFSSLVDLIHKLPAMHHKCHHVVRSTLLLRLCWGINCRHKVDPKQGFVALFSAQNSCLLVISRVLTLQ